MNRYSLLLEQMGADAAEVKEIAKAMEGMDSGMTLNQIDDQLATASTDLLLIVLLHRLLEERAKGQTMAASGASAKEKSAAAEQNEAAARLKTKPKSMSWPGSGKIISLIMMVAFGSITTKLIFPLSLIKRSDGSGEAASVKSLRQNQKDHRSNNAISTSPVMDIISPLPAGLVVPHPSPSSSHSAAASNRRRRRLNLKFDADESRSRELSVACVDTPNWKDKQGSGCDFYERYFDPGCPGTDIWAGDMGPGTDHCCFCMEGNTRTPTTPRPTSTRGPPTNPPFPPPPTNPPFPPPPTPPPFLLSASPTDILGTSGPTSYPTTTSHPILHLPTIRPTTRPTPLPTHLPTSRPTPHLTLQPTEVISPTNSPTTTISPTQCWDTPNWKDINRYGCDKYEDYNCIFADKRILEGDMGLAIEHCCSCGGGSQNDDVSRIIFYVLC